MMRILIAQQHEPGTRRLLRVMLEFKGHGVVEAEDGAKALQMLERGTVDAVISDILMANVDGFRLCHEIRCSERWRTIPFIFYPTTYEGWDAAADEVLALKLGGDAFLRRPATPEAILAALQEARVKLRPLLPIVALSLEAGLYKEYSERLVGRLQAKSVKLAQLNEELIESRARFEGVILSAVDAIIMVDHAERIVLFNAAAEKMFGCLADAKLGEPLAGLVAEAKTGGALRALAEPNAHACRLEADRSTTFPVEASISQLAVAGRELSTVILRDITARTRAQVALNISNSRFYGTLENIQLVAVILDRSGNITFCNNYLLELTGWKREEVLGHLWFDHFACARDEGAGETFAARLAVDGYPKHTHSPIRTRSGAVRMIAWNNTVLRDGANAIVGISTIGEDIIDREKAEAAQRSQAGQLRALALRVEEIRELERTAISRDIHDVLAQDLTRLKIDLVWLAKRFAVPISEALRPSLRERIASATAQADAAITHVQRIATELRPPILDSLGLPAAVEWLVEDFGKRTGLECHASAARGNVPIASLCSTVLFRILEECLTNVARHAQAKTVRVTLGQATGLVTLRVQDDGRGITSAEIGDPRSIGLIGMSERAHALGGAVEIVGSAAGTAITVCIPENPPKP